MIERLFIFFVILITHNSLLITASNCQQMDNFVFTQLKYKGEWDPYPDTWRDILEFISATTSIKSEPERRAIEIYDKMLFSSPFIVILGSGDFPEINEKEREILRRYLSNGGLIFAEDSMGQKGSSFDSGFRREISKIFPEMKMKKLLLEHPLFRSYYLLRKVSGRRLNNNYIEGLDVGGRLCVIYSQNDLLGAWAKDRFGNYLWQCTPGGEQQRFEAQKLTLDLIMYSVTGTYKSDAIHRPYLEQKLRR